MRPQNPRTLVVARSTVQEVHKTCRAEISVVVLILKACMKKAGEPFFR
jgi:hypothetical protein